MATFVIPAAAVAVYINGRPYGAVSNFHWTSATPQKAINGIDSLEAQELISTSVSVSGTIGLYRITGSGGIEGIGVTTQFDQMSREKYFVLQVIDLRSDQIIFQAKQCKVDSQDWGIPARGLITGNMNFKGLTWENEAAQQ